MSSWPILTALMAWTMLACASRAPRPPYNPSDPVSMLPEKRRVLYFKKGCDDPGDEISEVLGDAEDYTLLWKAKCPDGRVLRCSYHRLLKCRWEKKQVDTAAQE
jgi:hypothetical protein